MSGISTQTFKQKLESISFLRQRIEAQKTSASGKLPRHEWWRLNYYNFPYLIGAPDGRVADRFCDVFMNTSELDSSGGLIPKMGLDDEFQLIEKFTHLIEEWNSRGGVPSDVVARAREPFLRYFRNGGPTGVTELAKRKTPTSPFLVKYSRKDFLEPMLRNGEIRVCPATYYNDANHIASVRDKETTRTFFIPTFRERIRGEKSFKLRGRDIQIDTDDLSVSIEMPDYFLYSLSDEIYYRLPTDFDSDAALIIYDPAQFTQRLVSAFAGVLPDWLPSFGNVTYYDPYIDFTKISAPEMCKHFAYSYQREHRIIFRPTRPIVDVLKPLSISIGDMTSYAELVVF